MDDFREYVAGRMDGLRRTAFLLTGDWHTADDIVSVALTKLYRRWHRVSAMENVDAYVRRTLLRTWLNERRRPWRREVPAGQALPEPPATPRGTEAGVTDRMTVLTLLAGLPPRRRAVLVLRYFDDLSVEQTAAVLGISPGTVKSQTARALEVLRGQLVPALDMDGDRE